MPELKHLLLGMAASGASFYNTHIDEVRASYGEEAVLEAEMFLVDNCLYVVMAALEE